MLEGYLKRSIALDGRKTSVSLEREYWQALAEIAEVKNLRPNRLIQEISKTPISTNGGDALRYKAG